MAISGIKSSTPGMSSFSASENSFPIKNLPNLTDETVEEQKGISKHVGSINVVDAPCSPPPSLVTSRATFPPEYHCPVGTYSFALCLPIAQII